MRRKPLIIGKNTKNIGQTTTPVIARSRWLAEPIPPLIMPRKRPRFTVCSGLGQRRWAPQPQQSALPGLNRRNLPNDSNMNNVPTKPPEEREELAHVDDAIIGRAVRWSLAALSVIVLVGVGTILWLRRAPAAPPS